MAGTRNAATLQIDACIRSWVSAIHRHVATAAHGAHRRILRERREERTRTVQCHRSSNRHNQMPQADGANQQHNQTSQADNHARVRVLVNGTGDAHTSAVRSAMGVGVGLHGLAKTLSVARYDSAELTPVGLDSPRRRRRRSAWPYDEEENRLTRIHRGCLFFWFPEHLPSVGGESYEQVATSWLIPSALFLVWRVIFLFYMISTTFILLSHGGLENYPVSIEIYFVQAIAAIFMLVPHFVPSGKPNTKTRTQSTLNDSFVLSSNTSMSSPSTTTIHPVGNALYTIATVSFQSTAALIMFWDLVYWTQLHTSTNTYNAPTLILHSYSLVPVAIELAFGLHEFRPVYFIAPGLGFALFILQIAQTQTKAASHVIAQKLFAKSPAGLTPHFFKASALLTVAYAAVCVLAYVLQRLRQIAVEATADAHPRHVTKALRQYP